MAGRYTGTLPAYSIMSTGPGLPSRLELGTEEYKRKRKELLEAEYLKEQEEVNEIFGFGKKKKKVDLGVEDLAGLSYDIGRFDGYIDTIKDTSGDFAKLHLEQLIKVYEENVDPMISRLMIAKSQIDKETHELESSIEKKKN